MTGDPVSDAMWADLQAAEDSDDARKAMLGGHDERAAAGFLGYTIVGLNGSLVAVPVFECQCPRCQGRRLMDPACDGCSDLGTACPDHETPT